MSDELKYLPNPQLARPGLNVFEEAYPILVERVKEIEKEILENKLDDVKLLQLQNELKEVKEELSFCSAMIRIRDG